MVSHSLSSINREQGGINVRGLIRSAVFEIELIPRIQWYISESHKTSLTRGWVLKCWLWLSIVDDMCNPKILSHVLVLGYNSNSDLETYSIEIIYKLYMLQRLKKYSYYKLFWFKFFMKITDFCESHKKIGKTLWNTFRANHFVCTGCVRRD